MNPVFPDHGGIAHAFKLIEDLLDVLREHLEALGCGDHFFFPAADQQMAVVIQFSDVPGVKPAVLEHRGSLSGRLVVAVSDVVAAHQDLAVGSDLDVHSRERFPDGSLAKMERMAQSDDRRGFRESIALHDEVSEARPELFELRWKRRAPRNEAPILPAEQAVHAAEAPPAQRPRSAGLERIGRLREPVRDEVSQNLEDLRHRDKSGNTARFDLPDNLVRAGSRHEHYRGRNHRRNEQRERLPEQVAQRQKIQDPKRQEGPCVFAVLGHLAFDRFKIRQQVPVRDHDALGLRCGSRSEHDFGNIIRRDRNWFRGGFTGGLFDLGKIPYGRRTIRQRRHLFAAQNQSRVRFLPDAMKQADRGLRIHRHQHDSFEQAGPQRHYPARPALRPQHHGIAFTQSLRSETRAQRLG